MEARTCACSGSRSVLPSFVLERWVAGAVPRPTAAADVSGVAGANKVMRPGEGSTVEAADLRLLRLSLWPLPLCPWMAGAVRVYFDGGRRPRLANNRVCLVRPAEIGR